MLLGTLAASILGNALARKVVIRAGQIFQLYLTHQLILKYKNIIKMNLNSMGFFSRNNLSEIKDGWYIIYLDEYESIGNHWIALYVNAENINIRW